MFMNKDVEIKSMLYQKRILGTLCILLAPLCLLFGLFGLDTNLPYWYKSISATFYANSNMFMIGLLFSVSVFFFSYICYDWRDRVVTLIEAVCSIGIVIFPCASEDIPARVGLFQLPFEVSNIFHCIFAALLFLAFGFQITFLFTISGDNPSDNKIKRNRIYRVCGIVIFVFCIVQFVSAIVNILPYSVPTTWINEFIMLTAFGIAYLVKSQSFKSLND